MSDFDALVSRMHDDEVQLCAFDLLALEGDDQRSLPAKTGSSRRHGRGFSADPGPRHSPSADRYGVFTLNQAQGRESHLILPASPPSPPGRQSPASAAARRSYLDRVARMKHLPVAETLCLLRVFLDQTSRPCLPLDVRFPPKTTEASLIPTRTVTLLSDAVQPRDKI